MLLRYLIIFISLLYLNHAVAQDGLEAFDEDAPAFAEDELLDFEEGFEDDFETDEVNTTEKEDDNLQNKLSDNEVEKIKQDQRSLIKENIENLSKLNPDNNIEPAKQKEQEDLRKKMSEFTKSVLSGKELEEFLQREKEYYASKPEKKLSAPKNRDLIFKKLNQIRSLSNKSNTNIIDVTKNTSKPKEEPKKIAQIKQEPVIEFEPKIADVKKEEPATIKENNNVKKVVPIQNKPIIKTVEKIVKVTDPNLVNLNAAMKLGSCINLYKNINSCSKNKCFMMDEKNQYMLEKSVNGLEGSECIYQQKYTDDKGDIRILNCKYSKDTTKSMGQDIASFIKTGQNYNQLTTKYINNLVNDECFYNVIKKETPKVKMVDAEKLQQEKRQEAKDAAIKEKLISDADKKYENLLHTENTSKEQKNYIKESKPKDILKATEEIGINLAKRKQMLTDYANKDNNIKIDRGRKAEISSNTIDLKIKESKQNNIVNIERLAETAYRAVLSGQLSAAISLYKQILEADSKNEDALFGLAASYHKNSQYEQAKSLYIELLQLNPSHKEGLNNFLDLLGKQLPKEALIELKKLEKIDPTFSPVPAQIAMIYIKLGDFEKAESYFRRAIILAPKNLTYKYNFAIISDKAGKVSQAIHYYREVMDGAQSGQLIQAVVDQVSQRLRYLESLN